MDVRAALRAVPSMPKLRAYPSNPAMARIPAKVTKAQFLADQFLGRTSSILGACGLGRWDIRARSLKMVNVFTPIFSGCFGP